MNTILRFSGTGIACLLLVAGTISANADIGRDDIAAATVGAVTKSMGTQVALNPQPLPPRCLPPGCKSGGGIVKVRSSRSSVRQQH
jgi:hypothetical protein